MISVNSSEIVYMKTNNELSFFTLLLLISFASVNAVLFTPALPAITHFFSISSSIAQQTITWFLVGYALGQLIYGPIANRFGRKSTLYAGISLQIISSMLCILAGIVNQYTLLVIGRFMLALGSGVGLKMTFTLVNECYEPKVASQKISYLLSAFAMAPGIATAFGGVLTAHYGWISCFYAGLCYGVALLVFVFRLPETQQYRDVNAFEYRHLISNYIVQFKNIQLIIGSLLMGCATCIVYIFAAVAPFIVINIFGMSSTEYGMANMIPPVGLILGSLVSAQFVQKYSLIKMIKFGIFMISIGVIFMMLMLKLHYSALFSLFLPMVIVYFGLCFIVANVSTVILSNVSDKSHGSAVMNFINMGLATLVVLSVGYFSLQPLLLPMVYLSLCVAMINMYLKLKTN